MKIALVQPKFDRRGGAERYALELARGLAAAGETVHVFARRAAELPPAVALHRLPALALGRAVKTWSFCREAERRVDPGLFDVVQGFGKTTCQSVHRTGGGVHRAFLERGGAQRPPSLYDKVVLRIEDALFASARLAAVICPSLWVAREVERYYPAAAPKLRVIANGVDTERFAPAGREGDRAALERRIGSAPGESLLLFVATNFRLKGLETAVAALASLPASRLIVAGGDDPGPFLQFAQKIGVADRLHFLGPVAEPAPLYRAADVMIHPTRYDPFANVSLEALACGTPVVTTEKNGAADLLRGGEAGRVLAVADEPEAFAEAVRDLQQGGPGRREVARAIALLNDQRRHVERVLDLYREVAAARRSGASGAAAT